MELDVLKRHWEAFGRDDPMWAVLTAPDRTGGRWDRDEFLATGEHEVAGVLDELARLGVTIRRGRALDFGCGVGRLTQALAERFERCDGVDIAASMVAEARRINRHGDRLAYHVNDAPNLGLFAGESFDFVLSLLVLQHMEPRYAKRYIAEFIRVLKPGGVAVFQLPSALPAGPAAPLPEAAFRASIAVVGEAPDAMSVLEPALLRVRVRNVSSSAWPVGARVRVGNHWRDRRGRLITRDDGRSDVATHVAAGEEATVDLTVRAPAVAGAHTLELDLVQEGVCWFARRGSRPLRLAVDVASATGAPPPPATPGHDGFTSAVAPVMEMHTVAVAEVRDTVAGAGAEVLHELADTRAGTEVEDHRYIVRRVAQRTPPLPPPSLSYLREAIAAVPDRPDMFPPLITRRQGAIGRIELRLRHAVARALRFITWIQSDYNRAVVIALRDARDALEEQEAELRRLREELERLKQQRPD